MAGSKGFVGRGRELSVLRSALDGDARLVLVVGDAGVGKTRFVREVLLRLAVPAAVLSARGSCLPLAEKLPLLPVADALDELSRLEDGQLLRGALDATPSYVRAETARLLPELGSVEAGPGEQAGQWRRERLFSGVAELLAAVARPGGLCLVIEDVHWADGETLDFLTFLARAGRGGAVTVVATCRSDEVALDPVVTGWLAHARGGSGVTEVWLGPLSRDEVAEQAAGLAGGPLPAAVADELYARSEGNPFFAEQLVAAALARPGEGGWQVPAAVPPRLAELLAARVSGCGTDARAVLAALAVAGRPLTEDQLRGVAGLPAEALRGGLRELAGARLLGDMAADGVHRLRHVLLAEAVAAGLLPGERLALHECVARMLEATGDQALAAETAAHWAAAGRPAEELRARAAAGEAAERVFGYAVAGAHWERAIELCQGRPGAADEAGLDVPALYVRAMDAWHVSGDTERAGRLAEEALRRFAGHPEAGSSAIIYQRAARFRGLEDIYLGGQQAGGSGLALIEEALRRFEQAPPSAEYAEALFDYGNHFLMWGEERHHDSLAALNQALEVAETVGATALISRILSILSEHQFMQGQVGEGFAVLARARALAESASDGEAALLQAVFESDALVRTAQLARAAQAGMRGLPAAEQAGLAGYMNTAILACNTADALISAGRVTEAAALIDPLTREPPDQDHWLVHQSRAEIDVLRGDLQAAARRQQQIAGCVGDLGSVDWHRENAQRAAELALWSGQPAEALDKVRQATARFTTPYWAIFCGRLLAQGMRACADLAERARARRDEVSAAAAADAGRELASWVGQMAGAPFASHPFVPTIPAEHATWHAERGRLEGAGDPAAWDAAAEAWQALGFPHRAGYARWRQAEALQNAAWPRETVGEALRPAAALAQGHAPLLAEIGKLARRARLPWPTAQTRASAATPQPAGPQPAEAAASVQRLSARERELLTLLAQGRTNTEIAAQLYISVRTVGSHLDRIRDKTGCRRRADLTRLALQAGLA